MLIRSNDLLLKQVDGAPFCIDADRILAELALLGGLKSGRCDKFHAAVPRRASM